MKTPRWLGWLMVATVFLNSSCQRASHYASSNINIIADGNSYVHGNNSRMTDAYTPFPALIEKELGITVQNFGVGGQTTLQMLADEESQVLSRFVPGITNILIVMEGGNDIYFHGNVEEAVANMQRYCMQARSKGFKVAISTLIHRNSPTEFGDAAETFNRKLDRYNELILLHNEFYDFVIRPDLEEIFNSYSGPGYDADGIHPNQYGQQRFADLLLPYIHSFSL